MNMSNKNKGSKTKKATKYVVSKVKSTDVARIASATKYSRSHVTNVLAGRRNNQEIITAAKKIAKGRK